MKKPFVAILMGSDFDLAVQMLALSDPALAQRIKDERTANGEAVINKNDGLMERLGA